MRKIVLISVLLLCGCTPYWKSDETPEKPTPPPELHAAAGTRTLIQTVPYTITVSLQPKEPIAGQRATITVEVLQEGEPVDLFATGRIMQIALFSQNLRDYAHFFFDTENARSPGRYTTDYVFSEADSYDLWIDINHNTIADHHGDKTDYRTVTVFTVSGKTIEGMGRGPKAPVTTSTVDEYTITLENPNITAGEITTLRFTARKPGGAPAQFIPANDPAFYTVSAPEFGKYDLQHIDTRLSTEDELATAELVLRDPGRYLFWGFFYVEEGDLIHILNPVFLLEAREPPKKEKGGDSEENEASE